MQSSQEPLSQTQGPRNGTSLAGSTRTSDSTGGLVGTSVSTVPEPPIKSESLPSEEHKDGDEADSIDSSGSIIPDEEKPTQKKQVSGDDLYRRSSQYETWSFSGEELLQKKRQANENGRTSALKEFESARQAMMEEKPEIFAANGDKLTSDILELISFEEEQKYLHFFCQQIVQICSHFKMPTQVKATAISFFKKFYLVNSVMEHRPRNILYTTVFLAAKSENYFIAIETFCSRLPKTKPEDILDLEFIILQSLKFTLLVHHAFRPLYGFFLDFQSVLLHPAPIMYDVNVDTIGKLYDTAKKWLNEYSLLSDAPFLFTPPQIALAALYDSDKRITDRYLRLKFLTEGENGADGEASSKAREQEHFDSILRTIKRCIRISKEKTDTTREESTKIDEKCFFALNPSKLLKRRIKALPETT